ncbi:MAG: hypothetical protein M1818_002359 [Claussenomyces sp. TS43310]|nr:MAG: hypothetical protein M1818_002359 [Claussenomyces sp. TS43310]
MPRANLEYPQGARNTVNRLGKKRGTYELQAINGILNDAMVVHVSFSPAPEDPFPAILPMIGAMGAFDAPSAGLDEPLDCYLHGYVSSRIMNLCRKHVADGGPGLPVCIATSRVDGLVLTLTPNSHSYNYRSAVIFGHAILVTETEEKVWAMERITNKVVPQRWENTRLPPNSAEMQSTQILRVRIESGSGKVRDGPPGDEVHDLKDGPLVDRCWTGFVPLVEQLGTPVPSTYNKVHEVPKHITEYVDALNKKNQAYADKVVKEVAGTTAMYGDI